RRADRAGAENNFAAGARLDLLWPLPEHDADRAAVLDEQAVDQHVGFEPQIWTVQHRLEEAARRRPAPATFLVDVEVADALVVAGVEVGNLADAHWCGGIGHRVQHLPRQPRWLDAPAAAGAVNVARPEEMVLEPLEHRQHVVPAPAGEAELTPVVVIGGLAA